MCQGCRRRYIKAFIAGGCNLIRKLIAVNYTEITYLVEIGLFSYIFYNISYSNETFIKRNLLYHSYLKYKSTVLPLCKHQCETFVFVSLSSNIWEFHGEVAISWKTEGSELEQV